MSGISLALWQVGWLRISDGLLDAMSSTHCMESRATIARQEPPSSELCFRSSSLSHKAASAETIACGLIPKLAILVRPLSGGIHDSLTGNETLYPLFWTDVYDVTAAL